MRYANKLFTTCLTECCVAKKVSQPLQRHLTVCRFWLLWSLVRCCSKWSCMPKIREQFCHWKESKYNKKSSRKRHCVNVAAGVTVPVYNIRFLPSSGSFSSSWALQLEHCHRNSLCRSACGAIDHRDTSQQCLCIPFCMNRCHASLYLKRKKNTAGPVLIALTTLLCTAMHITMSLWPPYTCSRSWD